MDLWELEERVVTTKLLISNLKRIPNQVITARHMQTHHNPWKNVSETEFCMNVLKPI